MAKHLGQCLCTAFAVWTGKHKYRTSLFKLSLFCHFGTWLAGRASWAETRSTVGLAEEGSRLGRGLTDLQ